MTIVEEKTFNKIGLKNSDTQELFSRFLSILLTALISALITFLQSLLTEPSQATVISDTTAQAFATGGILRSAIEYMKRGAIMRG